MTVHLAWQLWRGLLLVGACGGLQSFSRVHWWCLVTKSSESLWHHGLQHSRIPCLSPSPGVDSNSCQWVSSAIQPSHPLIPSLALNPPQHQGLFQWVGPLCQVAKVLQYWCFSISPSNEYSGVISSSIDWLDQYISARARLANSAQMGEGPPQHLLSFYFILFLLSF